MQRGTESGSWPMSYKRISKRQCVRNALVINVQHYPADRVCAALATQNDENGRRLEYCMCERVKLAL